MSATRSLMTLAGLLAGLGAVAAESAESFQVLRIVPVDPELSEVDSRTGAMTFYCPGIADVSAKELVVTVDGREMRVKPDGHARATVAFGALADGEHRLEARLEDPVSGRTVLKNAYPIRTRPQLPMPKDAKRLNNFVTEIADVPLSTGQVEFVNPRDGWVFVRFGRREEMRYLPRGRQVLRARPEDGKTGRIVVRLVKTLLHAGCEFAQEGRVSPNCPFTADFHNRHVFGTFNLYTGRCLNPEKDHTGADALLAQRERGARIYTTVRIGPNDQKTRSDAAAMLRLIEGAYGADWRSGIAIDETSIAAKGDVNRNFGEACWRFGETNPDTPLCTWWCDLIGKSSVNPATMASALSAAVNSGVGTGVVATEHYLCARQTQAAAQAEVDAAVAFSRSVRGIMPCALRHMIYYLGAYLIPGDWNAWCSPAPDMKALYVMFLRRLATDPEFADIGGTGVSRFYCDEEIARFLAAAVRYYCIEGGTDDLAARNGLAYLPGHVTNGDFDEGLSGWTVRPAAEGTIVAASKERYSRKFGQGRQGGGRCGDSFCVFTRSAECPNLLGQRITGLVPGRAYSLAYATADYDEVLGKWSRRTNETFTATLSGIELMPEKSYVQMWPRHPSMRKPKNADRQTKAITFGHKIVFRAKAKEAELTFSDWKTPTEPGGEPGERRLLNYVGVRPYYEDHQEGDNR